MSSVMMLQTVLLRTTVLKTRRQDDNRYSVDLLSASLSSKLWSIVLSYEEKLEDYWADYEEHPDYWEGDEDEVDPS